MFFFNDNILKKNHKNCICVTMRFYTQYFKILSKFRELIYSLRNISLTIKLVKFNVDEE